MKQLDLITIKQISNEDKTEMTTTIYLNLLQFSFAISLFKKINFLNSKEIEEELGELLEAINSSK